jgi:hypothetical protein
VVDGDDNGSDDEGSTDSVSIRDKQQNVVQTKCCIISECTGKTCGPNGGSPSIPLGRGDLHITHPELCE